MNKNIPTLSLTTLALAAALCTATAASAQVAGATTSVGISVTASTQVAMGWSVKKTLLGKAVFNDAGQKIGNVEDLIVSPDSNVSYVIVGAGGFVGIGRHDVAIPVAQIRNLTGKLVIPGATKESIQAIPEFAYAPAATSRDRFVAAAEADIAKGKTSVATLEKKADGAAADAKVRIDAQLTALRGDVKSAETKLGELKQATAAHWKEFEAGVSAATANLRKSIANATA